MGISRDQIVRETDDNSLLGAWYANLFKIGRHKCLIFTNKTTFFTLICHEVKITEIRNLPDTFRKWLEKTLKDEKIDDVIIQRLLSDCQEIKYSYTSDRGATGIMVNHTLNLNPYSPNGTEYLF